MKSSKGKPSQAKGKLANIKSNFIVDPQVAKEQRLSDYAAFLLASLEKLMKRK